MPVGYCSFTGRPIESTSDGIWDDGEWISWDYINSLQEPSRPSSHIKDPELVEIFDALVHTAAAYKQHTGRYLDIFGELGELYVEVHIGIRRHRISAAGSDGRLGDDFVEVKTISPLKRDDKVRVKRAGNFSKLCIVRITENLFFDARMIDRRDIKKGEGKYVTARYDDIGSDNQ